MLFLVVFVTFIVYLPALRNGFINWDDNAHVFENPHLNKPLPEAVSYFFGPHFFIGNYIPLTMITYAIEYKVAGLQASVFHGVNVFIHLVNVALVFWFIYLLSDRKKWVAAFVALFFGIHPMHVESVAWISELKDVLYSVFFLGALIRYQQHTSKPRERYSFPVAVLVLFLFSILSKPAAVVFPVVLLLLDLYNGRRNDKTLWLEKLPFFIISVFFGVVTVYAQHTDELIVMDHPFWQRVFFATHSLIVYIAKFFVPVNLSIFYPYPDTTGNSLPLMYYLSLPFVILVAYLTYRGAKKYRVVVFGSLFFFVIILPVLQLIPAGYAIRADRYTYLPYIGLLFLPAMLIQRYHENRRLTKNQIRLLLSAIAVIGTAAAISSYQRTKVWKSDNSIANDLLRKFPDDPLALNNKGFVLMGQNNYHSAVDLLNQAVQLKKDYSRAYINLANSYLALEQPHMAMRVADTAIRYCPDNHFLYNLRGYLFAADKNYAEAVKMYTISKKLSPQDPRSYAALAECYYNMGDYDEALKILDQQLSFQPENYIALNSKGYIRYLRGDYKEAEALFKESLRISPGYNTAAVNLQDCYKAMQAVNE